MSVAWALGGVCLLFATAIARLSARGIVSIRRGLELGEWGALILLVVLFLVGEGWGALQRKWVPSLIDRARALPERRGVLFRILAPLYGMSLIGAPAPRLFRAWTGTAAIVAAVLAVRTFPEPWRGMVDLAVAAALAWGLGAIVVKSRDSFA